MPDIGPDRHTTTKEQTEEVKKSFLASIVELPGWIKIVASICVGLWCLNFAFGLMPIKNRGTFGDTFGAVNSLFSALALLGVAWSISMQREATTEATRERKIAQESLDKQQESQTLQRFETTFFQLFSAFNAVVSDLRITVEQSTEEKIGNFITSAALSVASTPKTYVGKQVFSEYIKKLSIRFRAYHKSRAEGKKDITDADLNFYFKEVYTHFISHNTEEFHRYLRTLYVVLRFIEQSPIGAEQKKFYFHFFRAQLLEDESTLLTLHYATKMLPSDIREIFFTYGMARNANAASYLIECAEAVPSELFGDIDSDY